MLDDRPLRAKRAACTGGITEHVGVRSIRRLLETPVVVHGNEVRVAAQDRVQYPPVGVAVEAVDAVSAPQGESRVGEHLVPQVFERNGAGEVVVPQQIDRLAVEPDLLVAGGADAREDGRHEAHELVARRHPVHADSS